jgi:hypothetical protein
VVLAGLLLPGTARAPAAVRELRPRSAGDDVTATTTAVCLKGRIAEFGPSLGFPAARDVVYVGRPCYQGGWKLPRSQFANPYSAQKVGSAAKAVELYRAWLRERPELVAVARAMLRGKRLGCWCTGLDCHAVALARIVDGEAP